MGANEKLAATFHPGTGPVRLSNQAAAIWAHLTAGLSQGDPDEGHDAATGPHGAEGGDFA